MISRRQYFAIVLIMIAVFLLFQGTQLGREYWSGKQPTAVSAGVPGRHSGTARSASDGGNTADGGTAARQGLASGRIVCLAGEDTPEAKAAAQWAYYAKRSLVFASSAEDPACAEAELLLVPEEALRTGCGALRGLAGRGVNLLCLSLPAPEHIEKDDALRTLLGIARVYRASAELAGLHLFGGFLLGGEHIYVPENEKEAAELQDLPLETPWYIVRGGTETYLQGVPNAEDLAEMEAGELKNEDRPAVWWRHHCENAEVFVINGPYMADPAVAGGVLQAALSQLETASLYPVLDAQVFSVLDFPALSNENSAELLRLYGREMTDIVNQIILPSLVPLPSRYGTPLTAFAAPQTDYSDEAGPQTGLLSREEKTLREMHSELALSLRARDFAPLRQRLAECSEVLAQEEREIRVTSVWADGSELEQLRSADADCLRHVRTVLTAPDESAPLLGYLNDNVTLMRATGDAAQYSYLQNLRMLCRETSLGYDSSYCDLSTVWYPRTVEDQWQKRVERVISNLTTHGRPFAAFDHVTASECDAKLRRFLAVDFEVFRRDDEIELRMTSPTDQASFLLRLNDEEIAEMTGGSWTKLEDGAFLLRVERREAAVRVTQTEQLRSLMR